MLYAITKDAKSARAIRSAGDATANEVAFAGDLQYLADGVTLAFVLDGMTGLPRPATAPEKTTLEQSKTTAVARAAKNTATAALQNGGTAAAPPNDRLVYALSLMILDEFNLHTTFESALLSAIAAATSLANLQTRVAAITAIPQRTAAQVQNAIIAKISATSE